MEKSLFKDNRAAVDECLLETWCCLHWPARQCGLDGDLTISKVGREGFPSASVVKNPPQCRDIGLIPGLGRSPGGGHGQPLQGSFLENIMDRGAWRATVHRVAKSWT